MKQQTVTLLIQYEDDDEELADALGPLNPPSKWNWSVLADIGSGGVVVVDCSEVIEVGE